MPLINQTTASPTNKVVAGTLAAAVTTIIVYLVQVIFNVEIDVLVQGAITTVLTFLVAYITKNRVDDAPPGPGE